MVLSVFVQQSCVVAFCFENSSSVSQSACVKVLV